MLNFENSHLLGVKPFVKKKIIYGEEGATQRLALYLCGN